MQLKPFLLDTWPDQYEHGIEFTRLASGKCSFDRLFLRQRVLTRTLSQLTSPLAAVQTL